MKIKTLLLTLVLCVAGLNPLYATENTQALNLNTANAEQLVTLKGIGKSKSIAIVEYRKQHGDFKNVEQIVLVPGVGETIYLDNKDKLFVE
ncbi:ComEA family DNA-binding protein [Agarivorans sp. MS3-6]|uniref:ComEA family DNA-binding protein n=1 Tax=Agarivorans sp. TSD2052 TaxID=2937286 RepID=UPI00200BB4A1|nr:helix-hairpin-helix domain-containing protein [Agarivorans sp. TSD2052]UPW17122.1 helix-hairpin-helix domain-containing protein [Agarivorans sp. TSD2052]